MVMLAKEQSMLWPNPATVSDGLPLLGSASVTAFGMSLRCCQAVRTGAQKLAFHGAAYGLLFEARVHHSPYYVNANCPSTH